MKTETNKSTRLRAGRLSNNEREILLIQMGEIAQELYDERVKSNPNGYNLSILAGSLQYMPDVEAFENHYYLENFDPKLNELAHYFEYGTGVFNTKGRTERITPKSGMVLKFRKKWKGINFAASVSGVKPTFAFTKTVAQMHNNRDKIQKELRKSLGI